MLLLGAALTLALLEAPPAVPALTSLADAERARNNSLPPTRPAPPPRTGRPPARLADEYEGRLKKLNPLLKATEVTHPDYPDLLMRLAQHFDEKQQYFLEQAAHIDVEIAATDPAKSQKLHVLHAKRTKFQAQAREASEQMVKLLKALVSTPALGKSSLIPEALLVYSIELFRLGRDAEAKDAAIRLIQDYPDSPYVTNVYLRFAHYYLAHGKLTDARQLFDMVLTSPAIELHPNANVGLGWSWLRSESGEAPRPDLALTAFVHAIESKIAADDATVRSARDGLVHAFAAAGRPERAAALFQRLTTAPHPTLLLERLALAYTARGEHRESATIYTALAALEPSSPMRCTWQMRNLLTAVAARDPESQLRHTLALADLWRQQRDTSTHAQSVRRQCRDDTRTALTALAQQWHTHDPARTTKLCTTYLDLFPNDPIPQCPAPTQ